MEISIFFHFIFNFQVLELKNNARALLKIEQRYSSSSSTWHNPIVQHRVPNYEFNIHGVGVVVCLRLRFICRKSRHMRSMCAVFVRKPVAALL